MIEFDKNQIMYFLMVIAGLLEGRLVILVFSKFVLYFWNSADFSKQIFSHFTHSILKLNSGPFFLSFRLVIAIKF